MSGDPRTGAILLAVNQSQKEVTANELFLALSAISAGGIEAVLAAPPGSPLNGQAWIVATLPSGIWAGKSNQIAYYFDGWRYINPYKGLVLYNSAAQELFVFNGATWQQYISTNNSSNRLFNPKNTVFLCNWETSLSDDITGTVFTNTNTVRSSAQVKFGSFSAFFNGAASLAKPAGVGIPNFNLDVPFSFRVWVYPTSIAAGTIMSIAGSEVFRVRLNNGKVLIGDFLDGVRYSYTSNISVTVNQWNLIEYYRLGTGGATNQVNYLFINGELDHVLVGRPFWSVAGASPFYIGAISPPGDFFNGYIDSLQICRSPMSMSLPTDPFA